MDIKQIRTDYENGTVIGRATWAELIEHFEQSDAVLNGRQQKIGEQAMAIAALECRIRTLEQDCRDWEKVHKDAVSLPRQASNPAAHDWAAPCTTIDCDEFRKLLFALAQDWTRSDRMSAVITYIDARIAAVRMADKLDAERLNFACQHLTEWCPPLHDAGVGIMCFDIEVDGCESNGANLREAIDAARAAAEGAAKPLAQPLSLLMACFISHRFLKLISQATSSMT